MGSNGQRFGVIRDRRSDVFGFAIWDYRENRYHGGTLDCFVAMTWDEAHAECEKLNAEVDA